MSVQIADQIEFPATELNRLQRRINDLRSGILSALKCLETGQVSSAVAELQQVLNSDE